MGFAATIKVTKLIGEHKKLLFPALPQRQQFMTGVPTVQFEQKT